MKIDPSQILRIVWSKRENDFMIHYPSSPTGSFISQILKPWQMVHPTKLVNKSWEDSGYKKVDCYEGALGNYSLLEMDWLKELDRRGYDIKTLKISIKKKKEHEQNKPQEETNQISFPFCGSTEGN